MLKSTAIIAAVILVIVVPVISPANVNASDMMCDKMPNHEYCTGERGKLGMIFCDLLEPGADDCYDRENRIDCNEKPEHKWCTGEEGIDGWEYCDLKTERKDCKDRT